MATAFPAPPIASAKSVSPTWQRFRDAFRRHPMAIVGGVILAMMIVIAVLAPYLATVDPQAVSPVKRLKPPSSALLVRHRHARSRRLQPRRLWRTHLADRRAGRGAVVHAARHRHRRGDRLRPLARSDRDAHHGRADVDSVGAARHRADGTDEGERRQRDRAITLAEVPRVVRLVRGLVLSLREQTYVEAAIAAGTTLPRLLMRHILPNIVAPLLVQGTYVCGSAMITEAILSFIGAGTPPNIPSWGNIMAEGRSLIQIAGYLILFPGICLSLTVLAVNLLGDGMRDALDPRLARRI